jgi:hypothetical protein
MLRKKFHPATKNTFNELAPTVPLKKDRFQLF